jgi:hypothetical protein
MPPDQTDDRPSGRPRRATNDEALARSLGALLKLSPPPAPRPAPAPQPAMAAAVPVREPAAPLADGAGPGSIWEPLPAPHHDGGDSGALWAPGAHPSPPADAPADGGEEG